MRTLRTRGARGARRHREPAAAGRWSDRGHAHAARGPARRDLRAGRRRPRSHRWPRHRRGHALRARRVSRCVRGDHELTTVRVDLDPAYDVVVASGALVDAGARLAGRRRVAVVSQAAIADQYADRLRAGIDAPTELFLMGDGEEHKSFVTVEDL